MKKAFPFLSGVVELTQTESGYYLVKVQIEGRGKPSITFYRDEMASLVKALTCALNETNSTTDRLSKASSTG